MKKPPDPPKPVVPATPTTQADASIKQNSSSVATAFAQPAPQFTAAKRAGRRSLIGGSS